MGSGATISVPLSLGRAKAGNGRIWTFFGGWIPRQPRLHSQTPEYRQKLLLMLQFSFLGSSKTTLEANIYSIFTR